MADPAGRRASGSSHRSNNTRRTSSRSSRTDVFSDDHAIDFTAAVDGFRPASPTNSPQLSSSASRPTSHSSLPRPLGRRSVALQPSPSGGDEGAKRPRLNRSSTAGPEARNSFSLRHDAPNSDMPRRIPSITSTGSHDSLARPLSLAAPLAAPRAQSPFSGPNQPSHPYAMYPQSTVLNRSSTVSSSRPGERAAGAGRPTHPYAMYPQGTVPDTEALADPADIANVGFPGLRQQYTRRLGPDGEEADDIIGPDGHTEQLPPYSREPPAQADALPRKEVYAPPGSAGQSSGSPTEALTTGGSPASAHDRLIPTVPQSPASAISAAPPIHAEQAPAEESPSFSEKWSQRSRKRICGGRVPRWVIIAAIVLAIAIAAVIGGVVGKMVGKQKSTAAPGSQPRHDEQYNGNSTVVVTTTLLDATPLMSAPPNLPTLAYGNFIFPMAPAISVRSACLPVYEQKRCWECSSGVPLKVEVSFADDSATKVRVFSDVEAAVKYGPVPPVMAGAVPVQLVVDTDQPSRGPAYLFQQVVNKTVILAENQLAAPTDDDDDGTAAPARRSWDEVEAASRLQPRGRKAALAGEKPWVCHWNQTMLQGFVYVTVDAKEDVDLSLASSAATASPTPDPAPTSLSSVYGAAVSEPGPTPTTYPSGHNPKARRHAGWVDAAASAAAAAATEAAAVAASGGGVAGGGGGGGSGGGAVGPWPSNLPVPYPKAIKLEERRLPGISTPPYCQQMQVLDDGQLGPLDTPVLRLTERQSSQRRLVYRSEGGQGQGRAGGHPHVAKRGSGNDGDNNYCACVWVGQ